MQGPSLPFSEGEVAGDSVVVACLLAPLFQQRPIDSARLDARTGAWSLGARRWPETWGGGGKFGGGPHVVPPLISHGQTLPAFPWLKVHRPPVKTREVDVQLRSRHGSAFIPPLEMPRVSICRNMIVGMCNAPCTFLDYTQHPEMSEGECEGAKKERKKKKKKKASSSPHK